VADAVVVAVVVDQAAAAVVTSAAVAAVIASHAGKLKLVRTWFLSLTKCYSRFD